MNLLQTKFKRGDIVRVNHRFDRQRNELASRSLGLGPLTVEAVRTTHPDDMRGVGHPQQLYINGMCWSGAWFELEKRYDPHNDRNRRSLQKRHA